MSKLYSVPAMSADSFRQFVEREALKQNRRRELVVNDAVNQVLQALTSWGYAGQKIMKVEHDLKFDEPTLSFTGTINASLKLLDKSGEKFITLPIKIESNKASLPDQSLVNDVVNKIKTTFESTEAPILEKQNKEKEERLAKEIQKGEDEFKQTIEGLNKKEPVKKEAYNDLNWGEAAAVIRLASPLLPEDMQLGDLIYSDGLRYKLLSKNESNMKSDDGGAYWVFELVHSFDSKKDPAPRFTYNI